MAIYDPSTMGVGANLIHFNDDSSGVDPYFRVLKRRPSNRDIRNFDTPLPEDSGIADFKTLLGRTDYILEGKMYPSSQNSYEQGRRALRKLANVVGNQDDPQTDRGYVPYIWPETDQNKQLLMKVLFVDLPEDTQYGLVQPFKLYCKVKYPVIKGTTLNIADTQGASGTIIGAVGYPLKYPALLGKNFGVINSQATNLGDIPAYPESIVINGPIGHPRLTDITTGQFIDVDVVLNSTSDILLLKYGPETSSITANGPSVFNKLSKDSDLFLIPPGPNNFQLSGASLGAGARAQISFYDAYPLS